MYNIYIDEKNKLKASQLKDKRSITQINLRHKNYNNELNDKYQTRIKSFIVEMLTNPPIVISECKGPIKNSRQAYHEETNEKIKGRAGFVFGSFKSDKERIKESLENNMLLSNETYAMGKNQKSRNRQEVKKPLTDNQQSFNKQPALRFQARTDLERIKEALNQYNRDYSSIVSRQLSQLDLNVFQQKHKKGEDDSDDDNLNNEDSFIIHTQKSEEKNEESKSKRRRMVRPIKYKKAINVDAKKILAEYHYKTHFKGAESIAIAAARERNNSNNSTSKKIVIPRLFDKGRHDLFSYDSNDDQQISKLYKSSSSFLPLLKKNHSTALIESSYMKNQNPNRLRKDQINKEKFEQLKTMIQEAKTPPEYAQARALEQEEIRNNRENEMIVIGNEKYSIRNQLDIITNKMLNKCKVYKPKNKNNKIVHLAREGKLMMTNGMTVKDFESKYHLNMVATK